MIRERAAKYLSAKPNLRKMDVQGSSCGAATSLPGRAACQHRMRRRGRTGQIYLTHCSSRWTQMHFCRCRRPTHRRTTTRMKEVQP